MNDHRILASGNVAVLDESGRVAEILSEDAYHYYYLSEENRPTCNICDAFGHGYPGAGPCPLEDVDYSDEPDWAL